MEIFLQVVCPVIWSQRCTPRVQRQPRLSTVLKRPDLAGHRGTNAIRYRVVVGGQPSGNGGEDLRRLGAVVLRACGLGEAVHIGLGDVVQPRVAEHPADRIRRGTAKQAGRVRRCGGQPDLGTDHRKLGNVWGTAESNYGSSPCHLVEKWSMTVIEAGHKTLTVTLGRCRSARLLHFTAAPPRPPLTLNRQRLRGCQATTMASSVIAALAESGQS